MSERFAKRMAIALLIAVVLVAITNEGYPLQSVLTGALDEGRMADDGVEPYHKQQGAMLRQAYIEYLEQYAE